ncbi:MAG TPA: histidine phosphatase family protein [Thermomicrobiales bacterium]|nr:histidine phosphatase family protein [Thermomicrobiales bacterium]
MPEPNGHHPESTTLTLVRHGETDWNAQRRMQGRADIPLNEKGRKQAELVAQRLEGTQWDGIVSSPLVRVIEVSRAIARAIDIPEHEIIERHDLVERNFGEAEGMTLEERTERFGVDGHIPGIETYEELDHRVMRALREIEAQYRSKRVLVITHGGVITGTLQQLTDGELGHGKVFIANVSLTTIKVQDGEWHVEMMNDYSHLLGTEVEPITTPVTGSGQASVKR